MMDRNPIDMRKKIVFHILGVVYNCTMSDNQAA